MASSPLDAYPSRSDIACNPLLIDQFLAPADALLDGYIRGVQNQGGFSERSFVRLGVLRVISQAVSGRDFLRLCAETLGQPLSRSIFFDSLHSLRRLSLLGELNSLLVARTDGRRGDPVEDYLCAFPELRDRAIFAVDGHQLEHACHASRDSKGAFVPGSTLYLLCLHSALLVNLGAVQGDGQYAHEMPVFRRRLVDWLKMRGPTDRLSRPIFVGDPAFVDKQFWLQMNAWERRGALIITRTKANMDPIVYSRVAFDPRAPINLGIEADELVGFEGGGLMRRVLYTDLETGAPYEFLTTERDLAPGFIAMLCLLRWRIEKAFDTGKNKLQEQEGWATGRVAHEIQAHFFALGHNLLTLRRRELDRSHGIRELKVEKKRQHWMEKRAQAAAQSERTVHPLQSQLPRAVQLTAQFIRTLRNGIFSKRRWLKALPLFRASLFAYL